MKEADYSEDYGDYDDHDYARDTWDAMTDGMYGDMPDGFDGDYGFLGYWTGELSVSSCVRSVYH